MTIKKSDLPLDLPAIYKIINAGAALLNRAGLLTFKDLTAEKLLKAAQDKSGLNNFGNENFVKRIPVILKSLQHDHVSYIGKQGILRLVRSGLSYRLFLENELEQHPEIADTEIEKPVIVTGFARSGTSLLQVLLTRHPGCRWLRRWELREPFPTAPGIWGGEQDPRRSRFEAAMRNK